MRGQPPDCCSPRRIILRKLLLALSVLITVMMAATSTTAQAEPSASNAKQGKIHHQLVRYYHAVGYVKAIGAVAHRTIYSSNPRIRHRWRGAVRYLNHQKADAERKLAVLRAPPQPTRPPHYSALMCIHRGEGAWNANTGNGYFGGLQMDYGFMSTYGGSLLTTKGTADHWTPMEQIWVAEKAVAIRGFSPWPTTTKDCGLS